MVAFDAETYLRLLGERLLLDRDPDDRHRRTPLELPASALVTAGTIERRSALRVIGDYTSAQSARGFERGFLHAGPPAGRHPPGKLTPRQTVLLDHELAFGEGRLLLRDLAIMATGGGSVHFGWRSDAPPRRAGRGRMIGGGGRGPFPWGATALVITDDQGNRPVVSSGSGGGSESQWDGDLTLDATLSPTAAWLEIEGVRVALDRRLTPAQTGTEPLENLDAVERFLRRRLAVPEMPFGEPPELGPAFDALRAAGALSGRDRLVDEVEAIAARLPGRHGRPRSPGGTGGGTARPRGGRLPEPWRSRLARVGRDDGPAWTRVIGALTPPFDGIQVGFRSVTSDRAGFEAEFEVAPNVLHVPLLGELPIEWSARDDRGNHYLGAAGGWGGSDESASGTMRFWPALDPRARRLDLLVSAQTQRAIVEIPLPDVP